MVGDRLHAKSRIHLVDCCDRRDVAFEFRANAGTESFDGSVSGGTAVCERAGTEPASDGSTNDGDAACARRACTRRSCSRAGTGPRASTCATCAARRAAGSARATAGRAASRFVRFGHGGAASGPG